MAKIGCWKNNMKKWLRLLAVSFVFCLPFSAMATAPAKMLTEQGIRMVDLHGSFYEMGQQYGRLLHDPLIQFSQTFKKALDMNAALRTAIAIAFIHRLPKPERAFFNGVVEATGIKPRDLILLDHSIQMSYLAFQAKKTFGCSLIAASGAYTVNGQMIIGRNFDWVKEYYFVLRPELMITVFHPDQGHAFATLGYLGSSLSAVTAMNDQGLFLELNSGTSAMGPYIRFDRPSYFPELMNMMNQSGSFAELEHHLLTTPPEEGYLVTIANAHQAETVELSSALGAHPFARIRHADQSGLLMTTNSYRLPGWKEQFFTKMYNPISSTQSFLRYDHLKQLCQGPREKVTIASLKEMLTRPISEGGVAETLKDTLSSNPDYTYYSLIALPERLEWQIHTQDRPVWAVIDLQPFLIP